MMESCKSCLLYSKTKIPEREESVNIMMVILIMVMSIMLIIIMLIIIMLIIISAVVRKRAWEEIGS